jgi:hypothetical protein
MRGFVRKPLIWFVAAEVCVVIALLAVSWRMLAPQHAARLPALVLNDPAPAAAAPASVPPDTLVPPSPSAVPLLPGLNVDPGFWQRRLEAMNGAEAQFEALEWRLVSSALDSLDRYLRSVVLPSVERAESGGRKV